MYRLISSIVSMDQIPINIMFGIININKGVLVGGDHIVLLSNVDLSVIGTPNFEYKLAITVP